MDDEYDVASEVLEQMAGRAEGDFELVQEHASKDLFMGAARRLRAEDTITRIRPPIIGLFLEKR